MWCGFTVNAFTVTLSEAEGSGSEGRQALQFDAREVLRFAQE